MFCIYFVCEREETANEDAFSPAYVGCAVICRLQNVLIDVLDEWILYRSLRNWCGWTRVYVRACLLVCTVVSVIPRGRSGLLCSGVVGATWFSASGALPAEVLGLGGGSRFQYSMRVRTQVRA